MTNHYYINIGLRMNELFNLRDRVEMRSQKISMIAFQTYVDKALSVLGHFYILNLMFSLLLHVKLSPEVWKIA